MARWKHAEETYLTEHAGDGAEAIAEKLGRTVHSVQCKASSLGVSLVPRIRCPLCGKDTYQPLSQRTGWCRKCSVDDSADSAALKNRQIRMEIAAEKAGIRESERRRQAIYADTNRRKRELRRLREVRERNEKSKGEAGA